MADQFHKQKKINDSTYPHRELSSAFATLLSQAMLENDSGSVNHALQLYKKKSRKRINKTDITLIQDMLKSQTHKKKIRNKAPDPKSMERNINDVLSVAQGWDQERIEASQEKDDLDY